MEKVTVKSQDTESPVPVEMIAEAIMEISKAMKVLSTTRLTRAAIVLLISDRSQVSRSNVQLVLNNLENLELLWLKPKKRAF